MALASLTTLNSSSDVAPASKLYEPVKCSASIYVPLGSIGQSASALSDAIEQITNATQQKQSRTRCNFVFFIIAYSLFSIFLAPLSITDSENLFYLGFYFNGSLSTTVYAILKITIICSKLYSFRIFLIEYSIPIRNSCNRAIL